MNNIDEKAEAYNRLIQDSQAAYRAYPDRYKDRNITLLPPDIDIAVVDGQIKMLDKGISFCKEINLYTYWQGLGYAENENKKIKYLLVAQDFGNPFNNQSDLMRNIFKINAGTDLMYLSGIDKSEYDTDENLIRLFAELGYKEEEAIDKKRHSEIFFTNFSLGYRKGKESGSMTHKLLMQDSDFFKRLCDILEPENILCLGSLTFECVYETLFKEKVNYTGYDSFNSFIEDKSRPVIEYTNGYLSRIFPLAHCGAMGTMNRNKIYDSNTKKLVRDPLVKMTKENMLDKQLEDWRYVYKVVNLNAKQ